MIAPGILRFLDAVQKDLEAADVRVEIGGKEPDDPHLVSCDLSGIGRLVAVFDMPPKDVAVLKRRLETLAGSFSGTLTLSSPAGTLSAELATRRLDEALADLAARVEASGAVVIDAHSPVIWGNSEGDIGDREVPDALVRASRPSSGSPQTSKALIARAIAAVREADEREPDHPPVRLAAQMDDLGYLSRSFAATYRIVLAYPGPFSELVAEGTTLHALPYIERLVMALPPVDPPPKRAKVVKLSR